MDIVNSPYYDTAKRVYSTIFETPFEILGIGDSQNKKAIAAFIVTSAALWALKPDAQFYQGKPRPFSVTNPFDDTATPFPWYISSAVIALFVYMFV